MESKCFSCKNKNVKTSYGYTVCNYSGSDEADQRRPHPGNERRGAGKVFVRYKR